MTVPLGQRSGTSLVGFLAALIAVQIFICPECKLGIGTTNPVQSSISQFSTCPLFSVQKNRSLSSSTCSDSNRTAQQLWMALHHGSAQKLGNNLWPDSESIATVVLSQIGSK